MRYSKTHQALLKTGLAVTHVSAPVSTCRHGIPYLEFFTAGLLSDSDLFDGRMSDWDIA